ncbi:hypothetical protein B296_00050826 [Ensete ventricosum]|uniref:Homeobox domain-containing protein n=1 Tax=Ensete ventricosum TaxID=4639 RepID=A0A426XWS3_ENSVE|nr:hypothetical protein B296_00050826 [Ensete ventricosum]
MFKVCPHPDEKQRKQLSRDLGLEPRQIKFWFQNRRTQMKATALLPVAQQERTDNCLLRAENDKIRCENIAMREALRNVICPSCGGPPPDDDPYFDEQHLRMENAKLKEEVTSTSLPFRSYTCIRRILDRVSSLASKYLGRPITQLPPVQPVSISSLDLSVGGYSNPGISPSLDLDLLCQSSSSAFPYPFPASMSELEKPLMVEMATGAMEEVIRLVQTDEPLWVKSGSDGRDILQLETYDRMFQRSARQLRFSDTRVEASRDSALVVMNAVTLVDMFMDAVSSNLVEGNEFSFDLLPLNWISLQSKWGGLFPTVVSKARTVEVLAAGMAGSRSGSLVLVTTVLELFCLNPNFLCDTDTSKGVQMYEELQVLSPVVPTRDFCFLRYCQQIEPGVWAVADVSVDFPGDNQLAPSSRSRRLPSGCLIEEIPNGYSKVIQIIVHA